jgi:hypothetical protein
MIGLALFLSGVWIGIFMSYIITKDLYKNKK